MDLDGSVATVGVLDKAVRILDALEFEPRSLADLVESTGLPRATVHRLAMALVGHDLLARSGRSAFRLGPRFTTTALAHQALPVLERLRDLTGESVQLYVRRGDRRLCVAALQSPHGLRTIVAVGELLPLEAGSAGKVLREAGGVLERGWVESVGEREVGVASVSAPVLEGGHLVAAVSVSGPIERTSRHPGRRYADAVVVAARELGDMLGGEPILNRS
ncbi:MAG: IclR family transcriptional regulator [Acidimicrobiales bacterium]